MASKKTPGRFTIQFNMADPQQAMAASLLEQQGRRKAQFLTSAVIQYICLSQSLEKGGYIPAIGSSHTEHIPPGVLSNHGTKGQTHHRRPISPAQGENPPGGPEAAELIQVDDLSAIGSSLAAFRKSTGS